MTERTASNVNDEALDAVIDADLYGYDPETGIDDDELDELIDTVLAE